MTAAKTHSAKRIILRIVLIVAVVFALLAATAVSRWAYNTYIAFNSAVLTGSSPFESYCSFKELDKLTDSDRLMVKKILDDKGIPYKEAFGTTIFVRYLDGIEAASALKDSGYEFDGAVLA